MTGRRALISVSDKTGVAEFARRLAGLGWEVLSTGGTARLLAEAGAPATEVELATGHPEMMEGRVKTLHPAIHAGILARRDVAADMAALESCGYAPIDLVAVNFYPFRETIADPGATAENAMDSLDVGGPAMLRAAAKNHRHVWVATGPADYETVAASLAAESEETPAERAAVRRRLAAKAFALASAYDHAAAEFLAAAPSRDAAPAIRPLRYGENPDQTAAFVPSSSEPQGLAALRQLGGKALSYNNLLDIDGALRALAPFAFCPRPAVAIVKHTGPCGLAVAATPAEAFERARRTDPVSAFGSVVAATRPVDAAAATALAAHFVECVVAPAYSAEALEALENRKNMRVLAFPGAGARFLAAAACHPGDEERRSVYGGMLVQSPPSLPLYDGEHGGPGWRVVTQRAPSADEMDDLAFAWAVVAAVKSNAIVLAKDAATVGIGGGLASRLDASRLAVRKAAEAGLDRFLAGAAMASDAFFPFRDGLDEAAKAGVRAVVQPGGSIRDREVVAAADEHGVAMVFTGQRLFRH